MQVKLWPAVEKGLRELQRQPDNASLKLSVAKIANFALACYITAKKEEKKSKC
jgi:hypothetical protein